MIVRPYGRVSTEEQAIAGYSIEAQKERLEAFAKSFGWKIADWYIDDGVSAKTLNRPEIRRLLDEINPGDTLLVYKLDRLTRSIRDLEHIIDVSEEKRFSLRSVTENIDTSNANGRLFVRLLIEVAQWEREVIGERTSIGKEKRVDSGEWAGGRVPFGYVGVPSGKAKGRRILLQLEPDPERAHLVPMIFERYLNGYGARSVAVWLNDTLNARSTDGKRFSTNAVLTILRNPIYCGDVAKGVKKGDVTRIPGMHEPLISRETFDRVEAMFERRKGFAPRQATGQYPLAGIARCGSCGGALSAGRTGSQGWQVYRCNNFNRGRGCGDPPLVSVSARVVEDNLLAKMEELLNDNVEFLRLLDHVRTEAQKQTGTTSAEIERLKSDLSDCEARYARWDEAFEVGKLSLDKYLERTEPLKERINALRSSITKLEASPLNAVSAETLHGAFVGLRTSWSNLTREEQKVAIQNFVEATGLMIVVSPDRSVQLTPALPSPLRHESNREPSTGQTLS